MTEFLVQWKVDVDGADPLAAAQEALRIHRDPESIATVFEVIDKKTGKEYMVDLSENKCLLIERHFLKLPDERAKLLRAGFDGTEIEELYLVLNDFRVRRDAVTARVWSDDKVFNITFDAVPWLLEAKDSDIIDLYMSGFGRDYPADKVARFMADRNTEIAGMFRYIEVLQGRKDTGFDVEVNAEQMLLWLKLNKPELWERYNAYCKREGVQNRAGR